MEHREPEDFLDQLDHQETEVLEEYVDLLVLKDLLESLVPLEAAVCLVQTDLLDLRVKMETEV